MLAAIALADKMARAIWAMMTNNRITVSPCLLPLRPERSAGTQHRAKRCKKPTIPWAKDRNDPDRENQIATASNRARDTDVDPLR